ncbi:outer membrane receptor FepA [Klebsiella pneumoniae]|uniref:TonB-dependent receptor n=1 Tax=Klebsiella pneumoniae TaxID=573 RepID=A0A2L1KSW1_KLEPN|nr:hypothetical protein A7321_25830 [Klebsiella pneumoniae]ANN55124.1 hypothetical protein BAU11_26020 [Klebsiella pneumoniae]AVE25589.1 hypothetical protein INF167p1_00015 [Klebsiella pneumoniae]KMG63694.1 hypothetical protein SM58_05225 [Klebsiella pneumoniae]KSY35052.1 hypothetical protein APU04_24490 [Klebsiella pneumoniae]
MVISLLIRITRREDTCGLSGKELGAYSPVETNFNYDSNKILRLNVCVSNILDKQIYRFSEGASPYNELGWAYYVGGGSFILFLIIKTKQE